MTSNELKEHRKRLNITQKELAIELCVTVRAVVSWETGTRNMPLSVEKLFCLIYGLQFRVRCLSTGDEQTPDLF